MPRFNLCFVFAFIAAPFPSFAAPNLAAAEPPSNVLFIAIDDMKTMGTLYAEEHEALRTSFRSWLDREVVPHHEAWEREGIVPRSVFTDAGRHGFLAFDVPEE